ncbi:hypothetical protein HNR57_003001 [Streptomyces paradoxus]|uniref:Uncharacterized protein n=1 Tax=Streptomyces paradoxus TaxID=66375 RepID=A0A7W9TBR4_9ACTN|nr:hypothetical protein [Streptomyces paradoxus]
MAVPAARGGAVTVPVTAATSIAPTGTVTVTAATSIAPTGTVTVTAATSIAATGTVTGAVPTAVTMARPVAATGPTSGAVAGARPARGSTMTTVRTGSLAITDARSVLTAARRAETSVTAVSGPGALPPGLTLPASGGEIMAVTTAVAVSGAGSAGRLGRWVGGTLRRGHRPIIARTRGALCSPRQNCR